MTIPFSVEQTAKNCLIELRDISDGQLISVIFHGVCLPGIHSVNFEPEKIPGGLDAGLYALYVRIGDDVEHVPVQYMP